MIYLLFAFVLILALAVVFLYSQLKIIAEYRNGKLALTFRCLFVKITIDDSKFKKQKEEGTMSDGKKDTLGAFGRIKNFKKSYDDSKDILAEILNLIKDRCEFSGIYIRVRYGTGEAAVTGMIYGAIWALVGNAYSLLCRFFQVEFPTIELEPVFGSKAFEIEAEGIITTKLVHIINAVYRSYKLYSKYKKQKGVE